ncbi:MAG: 6-phosphofructokinase [Calditrichaceae bacterium]
MKAIAVLTSGGDAPGMNASIRAVVRTAISNNIKVYGIERGFTGLIYKEYQELTRHSVSNIIQRGGTILKTSRCDEWKVPKGREAGAKLLQKLDVEGIVAIGGDGTFHGAHSFAEEHQIPIIGVPATIDNDIYGTDYTIGFDTAVNIALDAIDKIRDTADSHERMFIIEVMGRNSGFIALEVGIGGGAEEILVPEEKTNITELAERIFEGRKKGKTSSIIVVAEGEEEGNAFTIANRIKRVSGMEYRVVVLGHIQRGGSPTSRDRLLGSLLGSQAVLGLLNGRTDVMVGETNSKIVFTPLEDSWTKQKNIDKNLFSLAQLLA